MNKDNSRNFFPHQGSILRVEGIKQAVIVVSKNIYNETGKAIVCPMVRGMFTSATTYASASAQQTILCDQPRHLDLSARHYHITGELPMGDIIEISNIIESLFDYY